LFLADVSHPSLQKDCSSRRTRRQAPPANGLESTATLIVRRRQ
jgi:hypothetical protein